MNQFAGGLPDDASARGGSSEANRRKNFRVAASSLVVKAWRMESHERLIDRPLPSRRITMNTIDFGRGGAGAMFSAVGAPAQRTPLQMGDRVRLQVPLTDADQDDTIMLEGRVTYLRAADTDELRVGIEFQPALSESLNQRIDKGLDRILSRLQREEIRKIRGAA
jgi:hypothetical protein